VGSAWEFNSKSSKLGRKSCDILLANFHFFGFQFGNSNHDGEIAINKSLNLSYE